MMNHSSSYGEGASAKHRKSNVAWLWMGINFIMAVFFGLAALVQVKDPDPYLWVPAYLIPCLVCLSIVYSADVVENSYWRLVVLFHILACMTGMSILVVQVALYLKDRLVNPLRFEEGRELCGVIIVLVWMLICRCCGSIRNNGSTGQLSAVTWLTLVVGLLPLVFWSMCCFSPFNHCADMW
ncbi:transmembrane protein 220-like isoform X1 [Amphiura filiformis]|uniref:transmembrane protein 220-like isoform X1 n=1 Tax=Amphiura filiformis TaxID=82378 RepID=UPI003B21301A